MNAINFADLKRYVLIFYTLKFKFSVEKYVKNSLNYYLQKYFLELNFSMLFHGTVNLHIH